MQFGETLRVALDSLRLNLMRSLLTMLGIVIGVGAVIAMTALGNGAQRRVQDRIASLGTTLLQIDGARVSQGGVAVANPVRLTEKDAQYLAERSTLLDLIEPQQDRNVQIVWHNQNTNTQVTGAAANFLQVRRYEIDVGRMFTAREDAARKRVAVLGGDVIANLNMPSADAVIGDFIRIGGFQFEIVGVLKSKGAQGGFGEPDGQIVIPFETGRFRLFGTPYLNDLFVTAADEQHVKQALVETEQLLRKAHHIREDKPDDFRIRSSEEFLTTLGETTNTFRILLGGIAAVSLLVGGIGIMNIMLVVVTERTREIGIRKALGATRRIILTQFLTEAVVLCVLGGLLGAATGVGSALGFQRWFGWTTSVGLDAIGIAVTFSGAIGVLFGVWPAMRAARLDPIEALRFE
ncbi:MAG: ABC transporter permease [Gemmatimonadetes bacterium]|nr:ABC transporter permease [Gemmatimonadota bacterium]